MPYHDPIPDSKGRAKAGGLQSLVEAERLLQIIFLLPASVAICWFLGALVDEKLHTTWMKVVGIIFGCISGRVYTVRLARDAEKRAAAEDSKGEPGDDGSRLK